MIDLSKVHNYYVACGYTDLRYGIDGLAAVVTQQFGGHLDEESLFLFCGRRTDRIKALYWSGDGYEAHTACDKRGFVLGVEVTASNVHDSVAWDAVYNKITGAFECVKYVVMDAGYKTPWIAKKILEDGRIPILPYTRYKGDKERYKPWEYRYNPVNDSFICPQGGVLRHTTTNKDGKRTYRTTPSKCKSCPCKSKCGANEKGQKVVTTYIWQEFLDLVEDIRKTEKGKKLYAQRKETIERVFAGAKEKHAMRYTHHRGLAVNVNEKVSHSAHEYQSHLVRLSSAW